MKYITSTNTLKSYTVALHPSKRVKDKGSASPSCQCPGGRRDAWWLKRSTLFAVSRDSNFHHLIFATTETNKVIFLSSQSDKEMRQIIEKPIGIHLRATDLIDQPEGTAFQREDEREKSPSMTTGSG